METMMADDQRDSDKGNRQKPTPAPDDVSEQVPKSPPPPNRSQVPEINPPSAPPGHRDREQI
jgi:hypothetical protein